jgi:hypothetical protein
MAEVLSEIRTNQSGSDLPWKNKMRWRRAKTGDAMGRTSWRSSFLGAPGAKFFAERSRFFGPKNEEHLRRAKISLSPKETGRKRKLLQVCPKNLSH